MHFRKRAGSYLYAAPLLHMITIMELIALFLLAPFLAAIPPDTTGVRVCIKYAGLLFLVCLPVWAQLDARSRYQNYKQFKDQLHRYGFDRRILKPAFKSRCQRDAVLFAAREAGFRRDCEQYMQSIGYRWYHLLPEFTFRRPQVFLTGYFWKTTFFAPTYRPIYDEAGSVRRRLKGTNSDLTFDTA